MQDCLPLLHRRLQTTQAHMCEHALASGLVSRSAETHHKDREHSLFELFRTSPATAIGDSLAHVHVTAAPATSNKKNDFPSSSCSPASSQEARPCYSVWRRFCGEKPAIQGGHIKAHFASINDTGLDLCSALLTITPYIDNPTYIYIYNTV